MFKKTKQNKTKQKTKNKKLEPAVSFPLIISYVQDEISSLKCTMFKKPKKGQKLKQECVT